MINRYLTSKPRAVFLAALALAAIAQPASAVDPAAIEKAVKETWKSAPADWQSRVEQDETQRICSETHNAPSAEQADAIVKRETATIVYPADGVLIGDWKAGEAIAQNGKGGRFNDGPDTVNGGNCYACHQLSRTEVSYGTLGPSLLEYGKQRDYAADAVKSAYAKVFNAQAALACSGMPRFGYHKFLTEQQIKDVIAYLFDPESPVNK
jgi:sulfur-oxidizing protein SoxX